MSDPERVADRRGKPIRLAPLPPSRRAKAPLRRDGGQGASRFTAAPGGIAPSGRSTPGGTPSAFFNSSFIQPFQRPFQIGERTLELCFECLAKQDAKLFSRLHAARDQMAALQ